MRFAGFNALSESVDPGVVPTQTPGGTLLGAGLRNARSAIHRSGSARQHRRGYGSDEVPFCVDAPLARLPYGNDTFYYGSNAIFQSSDWDDSWEPVRRDPTNADPEELRKR